MEIFCLASGSSGNAYLFKHREECVLVECGIPFRQLSKKLHELNVFLGQIRGVTYTHLHNDHVKALNDLKGLFLNCVSPKVGTYNLCPWLEVSCFPVYHDIESYGFVFTNLDTNEKILFINDTSYNNFDFDASVQFDYVMIECNHLRTKVKELLENAPEQRKFKYERQLKSHLSLAGTKKLLKNLDLSNCKGIYLMHLSKEAGDPKVMKEQIEYEFNKKTYVCMAQGGVM